MGRLVWKSKYQVMKRKGVSKLCKNMSCHRGPTFWRTCKTLARMKEHKLTIVRASQKCQSLRAISVCCPQIAAAILSRQKLIENRTWPITEACAESGGWLALHVGQSANPKILDHVYENWDESMARRRRSAVSGKRSSHWGKSYFLPPRRGTRKEIQWRNNPGLPAHSAIVGFIRIAGMHLYKRGEKKENPWALGPVCWEIDRVVPLEPPVSNVPGNVMLWPVEEHVTDSAERKRLYRAFRQVRDSYLGLDKSGR